MMLNDLQRFPDKSSRAKSVKTMLENLGFSHVWFSQGVGNINAFMSILKQRITDKFVQNWSEQLENSKRANTYKLVSDFHFIQNLFRFYYCSKV